MDRKKLVTLYELIDDLLGRKEPSDADLNYDDDMINLYADIHNLKISMEICGFGGES